MAAMNRNKTWDLTLQEDVDPEGHIHTKQRKLILGRIVVAFEG